MEKFEMPPLSVFVEHGFAQHGESEWCGCYWALYHTYVAPENYKLPDAFAAAYGDTIRARSKTEVVSVKNIDGSGKADVDVEDSKTESSKNNGEKNPELSDFSLETRSILDEE